MHPSPCKLAPAQARLIAPLPEFTHVRNGFLGLGVKTGIRAIEQQRRGRGVASAVASERLGLQQAAVRQRRRGDAELHSEADQEQEGQAVPAGMPRAPHPALPAPSWPAPRLGSVTATSKPPLRQGPSSKQARHYIKKRIYMDCVQ